MRQIIQILNYKQIIVLPMAVIFIVVAGCANPLVLRLNEYRAAKKSGDLETAASYLSDDARIWYDKKEGTGSPLSVKGGRWKAWDRFFNARTTVDAVRVRGRAVIREITEINDFYRFIDRVPGRVRITYWFDTDDRISAVLVRGLTPRSERLPDRLAEFRLWAMEHHPDDLEFVMPGGEIEPDLERAKKWRELLTEWRCNAGLPPVGPARG